MPAHLTDLKYSDITPQRDFLNRRRLMQGGAGLMAATLLGTPSFASRFSTDEAPSKKEDVTSYNNFYEFGTGKDDPAKNADSLTTSPWSIEVGGMVEKPGTYDLGDLLSGLTVEERIYRFRCVEAWSMVVPWNGVMLRDVLAKVVPTSAAKYVAFETLVRPEEMPGQKYPLLDWPYREGLRMDEAMHPLTLLATGLYGEDMPNQNGAPIRLVVPWKYGFKSIKSIVKITLTDKEPQTSWNMQNAAEYGFYSNVNPEVDHPRWSQASERPIGGGLFAKRKDTLMFNGYAEEVASLYAGMDLAKNF